MSDHSPQSIRKHVKTYWMIFGALAILTVITVGVTRLPIGILGAVAVAMIVATIKSSLVAGFFMHLIGERKVIYIMLALCASVFIGLILFPILTQEGSPAKMISPVVLHGASHSEDHGAGAEEGHKAEAGGAATEASAESH